MSATPLDIELGVHALSARVAEELERFNLPGVEVVVVRDGRVLFAGGIGRRDFERDLPVTSKTVFAHGSTAKAFTFSWSGSSWTRAGWTGTVQSAVTCPINSRRFAPRCILESWKAPQRMLRLYPIRQACIRLNTTSSWWAGRESNPHSFRGGFTGLREMTCRPPDGASERAELSSKGHLTAFDWSRTDLPLESAVGVIIGV